MQKRGISPLISGILIIAFTIAIYLLITSWVKEDIVDEVEEGTQEKIMGEIECGFLMLDIVDACFSDKLKIIADNKGENIGGVVIRAFDSNQDVDNIRYESESIIKNLDRILSFEEEFDVELDDVIRIEVYPLTVEKDICSNKKESKTVREC